MSGRGVAPKARQAAVPEKVHAHAGYDDEWLHADCRQEQGVESVIKPVVHRADDRRNGMWRSGVTKKYLKKRDCGKRWSVETYFSGLKRTIGPMPTPCKPDQLMSEAAFKMFGHPLSAKARRMCPECFQKSKVGPAIRAINRNQPKRMA